MFDDDEGSPTFKILCVTCERVVVQTPKGPWQVSWTICDQCEKSL